MKCAYIAGYVLIDPSGKLVMTLPISVDAQLFQFSLVSAISARMEYPIRWDSESSVSSG